MGGVVWFPEIEFFCFVNETNFAEIVFVKVMLRFVSAKFRQRFQRNETKFY
jgi:hypothetical protein